MSVDWSKPIEAIHDDGSVKAMVLQDSNSRSDAFVTEDCPDLSTSNTWWKANGKSWCTDSPWRIRNVVQQTPTPDVVGEDGMRDLRDARKQDAELWDRMGDAIRAHVSGNRALIKSGLSIFAEFQAILALLPEPVDGDLLIAREMLDQEKSIGSDSIRWHADDYELVSGLMCAAIKKGKQLRQKEINQLHMASRGLLGVGHE